MSIKGKTVLVTGASSGIGKQIAKHLLKEGANVLALARNKDKMQDLVKLGADIYVVDIANSTQVESAYKQIKEKYNFIDVLVNNAGFGLYGAVEDTPIKEARYQFEVNLFGLARLTQLILPSMRENKNGTIINISSIGGKIYSPLGSWYHATKHALEGWSDALRLEVAQFGINIVIIEPGAIKSNFGSLASKIVMKYSGETAYKGYANAMVKTFSDANADDGTGSDPEVISSLVMKAINSNKPKTRYHAGKYATPMLFMRKWLSDKIFDKIVMSAFG